MKKRKIIVPILFGLLVVGAAAGIVMLSTWDKPLGPQLDLSTLTPTVTNEC